jgi:hypothetical protein
MTYELRVVFHLAKFIRWTCEIHLSDLSYYRQRKSIREVFSSLDQFQPVFFVSILIFWSYDRQMKSIREAFSSLDQFQPVSVVSVLIFWSYYRQRKSIREVFSSLDQFQPKIPNVVFFICFRR